MTAKTRAEGKVQLLIESIARTEEKLNRDKKRLESLINKNQIIMNNKNLPNVGKLVNVDEPMLTQKEIMDKGYSEREYKLYLSSYKYVQNLMNELKL